jgi:hypothetical protein
MNAKQELISHLLRLDKKMLCAKITHENPYRFEDGVTPPTYILKLGHTSADYNKFLDSLDFDYSNGYGLPNLFGMIWFADGVWMERGEYDGSEWWEIRTYPEIPVELESNNQIIN